MPPKGIKIYLSSPWCAYVLEQTKSIDPSHGACVGGHDLLLLVFFFFYSVLVDTDLKLLTLHIKEGRPPFILSLTPQLCCESVTMIPSSWSWQSIITLSNMMPFRLDVPSPPRALTLLLINQWSHACLYRRLLSSSLDAQIASKGLPLLASFNLCPTMHQIEIRDIFASFEQPQSILQLRKKAHINTYEFE